MNKSPHPHPHRRRPPERRQPGDADGVAAEVAGAEGRALSRYPLPMLPRLQMLPSSRR
jgi:hypothetical protein